MFGWAVKFGMVPPTVYSVGIAAKPEAEYTYEEAVKRLDLPDPQPVSAAPSHPSAGTSEDPSSTCFASQPVCHASPRTPPRRRFTAVPDACARVCCSAAPQSMPLPALPELLVT